MRRHHAHTVQAVPVETANHSYRSSNGVPPKGVPGRPRRRKKGGSSRTTSSVGSSVLLAVLLWYSLGVLSIATSKLLLEYVSPLFLTLQQLGTGVSLLKLVLLGSCQSKDKHPDKRQPPFLSLVSDPHHHLLHAGVCFGLGFLATNYGFAGSAASFVETIKAAEPISSAGVAVLFGLETLNGSQILSLLTIVAGVLVSTMGHSNNSTDTSALDDGTDSTFALGDTLHSSVVVLIANLCFSFRGLYQKLLRRDTTIQLDDTQLQFHMQTYGLCMLALPWIIFELFPIVVWNRQGLIQGDVNLPWYLLYATINGCAFTCYNLASTYVLSRISVIHHAALNCLRRVFAIIVTSLLFGVPLTILGMAGIGMAVLGFLSYTYFKLQANKKVVLSPLPSTVGDAS